MTIDTFHRLVDNLIREQTNADIKWEVLTMY